MVTVVNNNLRSIFPGEIPGFINFKRRNNMEMYFNTRNELITYLVSDLGFTEAIAEAA